MSVLIPVLDNTILNVAIPTILREFHTELPSLQWVITGYSLTFATLLIIGGRLGDIFGHRRMFIVGVAIFGVGSLLASISTSVPTLFLGEALIEGIGASLMIPATLSILSTTFARRGTGRSRSRRGARSRARRSRSARSLGGFLTTDYSWRWAFRINVIVAPLIVIGALVFMRPDARSGRRPRIDVPGRGPDRGRLVQPHLRAERGRDVRLVEADQGPHDRGRTIWPATRRSRSSRSRSWSRS